MLTAPVLDRLASAATAAADRPAVSVVIATHNRAGFLAELLATFDAQSARDRLEVVLVDDGSTDDTWQRLGGLVAVTPLRMQALRLAGTGGPSVPRNTGADAAHAEMVAFTDDDCLPEPGWVAALLDAAGAGGLLRGPVRPVDGPRGPWDRSIDVAGPTPWFETSNFAVSRSAFVAAGGFPVDDLLPGRKAARGFGEDVLLGHALAEHLGQTWVPDAVVRHRWLPGDFRAHLSGQWRVVGFPLLVRRLPALRGALFGRWFLSPRSAAFDVAVAAAVAGGVVTPWALTGLLPWCAVAWPDARRRGRGRAPLRLAQLAVSDAVTLAALADGSVRARRLVL
jgi:glycosyltransferase involved in cell wall biosynthesis